MTVTPARKSPARILIEHLLKHISRKSHQTADWAESEVVSLAIKAGLKFDPDDLIELCKQDRWTPWLNRPTERHYALAAGSDRGVGNTSFCVAYERMINRKPFTFAWETVTRQRIYEGARFWWQGLTVTCTSFAQNGEHLTAVTYKPGAGKNYMNIGEIVYAHGGYRRILEIKLDPLTVSYSDFIANYSYATKTEVERRFKITIDDLRATEARSVDIREQCLAKLPELTSEEEWDQYRKSLPDFKSENVRPIDAEMIGHAAYERRRNCWQVIEEPTQ